MMWLAGKVVVSWATHRAAQVKPARATLQALPAPLRIHGGPRSPVANALGQPRR